MIIMILQHISRSVYVRLNYLLFSHLLFLQFCLSILNDLSVNLLFTRLFLHIYLSCVHPETKGKRLDVIMMENGNGNLRPKNYPHVAYTWCVCNTYNSHFCCFCLTLLAAIEQRCSNANFDLISARILWSQSGFRETLNLCFSDRPNFCLISDSIS